MRQPDPLFRAAHRARPAITGICLQTEVVGCALRYVESDADRDASFVFSFDDEAAVRVNGAEVFRGEHAAGFRSARFTARLRRGRNRVLVKLSNRDNETWRFRGFWLREETGP